MFNPLRKTFESDNEGPNRNNNNKEKSNLMGNKAKVNKFKVPKNFGKKKFKYTIDEESDTNMILEQEYENCNKTEKSITNNINLRLLSHDSILWKKAAIFLLEIKIKKDNNKMMEEEPKIKNKTLEYLYKLTNSTKEFWKICEITDEKEIKNIIIDYIKQYTYKIKLLIIYLDKTDNDRNNNNNNTTDNNININDNNNNSINDNNITVNDNNSNVNKINIKENKNTINNNNVINCLNNDDLNDSGFRNDLFIDLFSCNEINIPFYVITHKYLYAKLFNKKMNYIFMNNDFLSDKTVKILLFHDKKISPNNSNSNLLTTENNCNKINKTNEPITITTRGFLPEFKETQITIEGSTSSTLSLSSDEDYLDNSVIYTKNGIGIMQFSIKNE
jgi:hypothetical protein